MPTVTHPTVPSIRFDVPAAAVKSWTAAGWLPPDTPAPVPDPAPTTTPRPPRGRRTKKEH